LTRKGSPWDSHDEITGQLVAFVGIRFEQARKAFSPLAVTLKIVHLGFFGADLSAAVDDVRFKFRQQR
jgi:hypothetical protein